MVIDGKRHWRSISNLFLKDIKVKGPQCPDCYDNKEFSHVNLAVNRESRTVNSNPEGKQKQEKQVVKSVNKYDNAKYHFTYFPPRTIIGFFFLKIRLFFWNFRKDSAYSNPCLTSLSNMLKGMTQKNKIHYPEVLHL